MNVLNEIITVANNGKIVGMPEKELREMIKICSCHASYPSWEGRQAKQALDLIRDEIDRQQTSAHNSAILEEQRLLTAAIGHPAKSNWIARGGFVVMLLTLVVCVFGYWEQIKMFFQSLKFW